MITGAVYSRSTSQGLDHMALGLIMKPAATPQRRAAAHKQAQRAPSIQRIEQSVPVVTPARPFTARQAAFIDHYMVSRNATDAARRSGFKTPRISGSRMLSKANIRAELDRRIAAQRERLELSADWVIKRLMMIADANIADYMRPGADGAPVLRLDDITREQAYALDTVTVEEFKDGRSDKREVRRTKFSLLDKTKALELLGRRFKLWSPDAAPADPRETLTLLKVMMREIDKADRQQPI